MPAIFGIEEIHSVHGRATASKEVNDEGIGFVFNNKLNGVMHSIQ